MARDDAVGVVDGDLIAGGAEQRTNPLDPAQPDGAVGVSVAVEVQGDPGVIAGGQPDRDRVRAEAAEHHQLGAHPSDRGPAARRRVRGFRGQDNAGLRVVEC